MPAKSYAAATDRNRDPIFGVLGKLFPQATRVLEIASGSGQHAVYFSGRLPHVTWQPSDADPRALGSIRAWRAEVTHANLLPPIPLDVMAPSWGIDSVGAIVCINMIHIAPWEATAALFAGASRVVAAGGFVFLYGPFVVEGTPTAPSNVEFDTSLRARDSRWGVRELSRVREEAERCAFRLESVTAMPANNLSVVFRRVTE